uniref:RING-type domain-containing protein n=1 Tax=Mola mola TaxID=94237 RepID=A0A3Q3XKF5_MOLML
MSAVRNMASALSEEQFGCSICLDIFHDPVSIPCGHNFCVGCIKRFWDTRSTSMCPLCKEAFTKQPELRINVGLRDITEQFKRSVDAVTLYSKRRIPRQPSKSDHVPCDVCNEDKSGAVKSCLVCRQSYCETHLTPHLRDQHMLTDPGTFVTSHLCRKHNRLLEKFCRTDSTLVCATCREREHRHHEVVPMEDESSSVRFCCTCTICRMFHAIKVKILSLFFFRDQRD